MTFPALFSIFSGPSRSRSRWIFRSAGITWLALAAVIPAVAGPPKLAPSFANVSYGNDPKQTFDVYLPTEGHKPYPVLVWYHGGGWSRGDKTEMVPGVEDYLRNGCAFVSVNYRLTGDLAAAGIKPPVAGVMADHRRSLQYVRLHAADWGLDPNKIIVGGSSAGACSALYLGAEGEQANPQSTDPVEQTSTKVLGVLAFSAQTSFDPKQVTEWVPGSHWGAAAMGYLGETGFDQLMADRDKVLPDLDKYSPDHLLSAGAPPIYFNCLQPIPPRDAPAKELTHCPLWEIGYQKLAQDKGVTCYLKYPGHSSERYRDATDFALHLLNLPK